MGPLISIVIPTLNEAMKPLSNLVPDHVLHQTVNFVIKMGQLTS